MFRFADHGTVFWPVTLRQAEPGAEGVTETTIHVAYKILTRKELRERERAALARMDVKAIREATDPAQLADLLDEATRREAEDEQMLQERVRDWRGIVDADEQPLAFSPERLAALLEYDVFFKPMLAGLHAASRAAREKNSLPGSGGTPAVVQA